MKFTRYYTRYLHTYEVGENPVYPLTSKYQRWNDGSNFKGKIADAFRDRKKSTDIARAGRILIDYIDKKVGLTKKCEAWRDKHFNFDKVYPTPDIVDHVIILEADLHPNNMHFHEFTLKVHIGRDFIRYSACRYLQRHGILYNR